MLTPINTAVPSKPRSYHRARTKAGASAINGGWHLHRWHLHTAVVSCICTVRGFWLQRGSETSSGTRHRKSRSIRGVASNRSMCPTSTSYIVLALHLRSDRTLEMTHAHLYRCRNARGDVRHSNRALGGVDVLPTCAAGPKNVEPELAATNTDSVTGENNKRAAAAPAAASRQQQR